MLYLLNFFIKNLDFFYKLELAIKTIDNCLYDQNSTMTLKLLFYNHFAYFAVFEKIVRGLFNSKFYYTSACKFLVIFRN